MKRHIVYCICSMLLWSCTEKQEVFNDFPKVVELTEYENIYSDKEYAINTVTDMTVYNNILIAKHMNDEYAFSFIDLETQNVCRWGEIGQGNGEFLDFGLEFSVRKDSLLFTELFQRSNNKVSINEILSNQKDIFIRRDSFPYTKDFRPSRFAYLGDVKIALGSFVGSRLGLLDGTNQIINSNVEYPFQCEEIPPLYRGSVYQGSLRSNEKRHRFVISTFSSDIFEIYQLADGIVKPIFVYPFNELPPFKQRGDRYGIDNQKSIAGITYMATNDEYICFKFSSGNRLEDMKRGFESNEILCFDWDGNKVKKLTLPFAVGVFCLDKEYLYAVRSFNDENTIYRFKIPN